MPAVIYALIDPRTQECRYVGKTERLSARLQDHLTIRNQTPRYLWLSDLMAAGLRPDCVVLEELRAEADWQAEERFWIAYLSFLGANLTNRTHGGPGGRKTK